MSACKPAATCNEFVRQGLLSACNHMNARARGRNITRNSCNEVVRQRLESLSTSVDDASPVKQRRRRSIATLSDRLKLSAKNAEIVYDQLRCARCDRVHQYVAIGQLLVSPRDQQAAPPAHRPGEHKRLAYTRTRANMLPITTSNSSLRATTELRRAIRCIPAAPHIVMGVLYCVPPGVAEHARVPLCNTQQGQ